MFRTYYPQVNILDVNGKFGPQRRSVPCEKSEISRVPFKIDSTDIQPIT
jgi:hypothetical protein